METYLLQRLYPHAVNMFKRTSKKITVLETKAKITFFWVLLNVNTL